MRRSFILGRLKHFHCQLRCVLTVNFCVLKAKAVERRPVGSSEFHIADGRERLAASSTFWPNASSAALYRSGEPPYGGLLHRGSFARAGAFRVTTITRMSNHINRRVNSRGLHPWPIRISTCRFAPYRHVRSTSAAKSFVLASAERDEMAVTYCMA